MPKFIFVTQREIKIAETQELRDSLDQRWFNFLDKAGFLPILLPNNLALAKKIISKIDADGILLTGGDDIKSLSGIYSKREELEDFLIKLALKKKLPLFGVCRGMQKIQDSFGIPLGKVSGHVSAKQKILINDKSREVNSFHKFGTTKNNDREFKIFAVAKDGVIKAIRHKKHNICAVMWHPERFAKVCLEDIKLFHEVFK